MLHVACMYCTFTCLRLSVYPCSEPQPMQKYLIPSKELGSAAVLIFAAVVQWSEGAEQQGYLWPSAWGGMCRWTRNKSIFGAQHMLALVHSRSWAVWLQHQINCGGMGEGKASEWVWRSNCYHTWQCLVWDPVVHAAYVSGWSSVRQSDRVWRVTRHIRSRQRMCLTEHRNFTPAQSFASTHIVRPTWSLQAHIWGLIYSTLTPLFCWIHTFLKSKYAEKSEQNSIQWFTFKLL